MHHWQRHWETGLNPNSGLCNSDFLGAFKQSRTTSPTLPSLVRLQTFQCVNPRQLWSRV